MCISDVEAKWVTPRFKHIDIPVYFLQEQLELIPPLWDILA